jgi:hypothetical protein
MPGRGGLRRRFRWRRGQRKRQPRALGGVGGPRRAKVVSLGLGEDEGYLRLGTCCRLLVCKTCLWLRSRDRG